MPSFFVPVGFWTTFVMSYCALAGFLFLLTLFMRLLGILTYSSISGQVNRRQIWKEVDAAGCPNMGFLPVFKYRAKNVIRKKHNILYQPLDLATT